MIACLVDTNVFVYALGYEHPYRVPCREVVARLTDGRLLGGTTTVVIAEYAHQRLRQTRDRLEAASRASAVASLCPSHPIEPQDLELALDLFARVERLDSFDALLAAVALNRDVPAVLSADRAFDGIDELKRVDPADAEAVAALCT